MTQFVYLENKKQEVHNETAGKKKSGIEKHPEARLFEQAQNGCKDSLNLLFVRHEPLVVHAVKRQNLGDFPLDEAV